MKKILYIFVALLIVLFLYPKSTTTGGFTAYPTNAEVAYKCFGFATYVSVPDASIMTCYGIPYESNVIQPYTLQEMMSLNIYIQDKEAAETRDCGITKKVTYQVPKTLAVADASLRILFENELSQYGIYKSVTITNGIAKVMLESDATPAGYPIGSLSSCQSGHLLSVLTDTLTQYESITSVELISPTGKIEF